MPNIDIRDHIVSATGTWQDCELLAKESPLNFSLSDTQTESQLLLRWKGDSVTLSGPLRVRITYQTENLTYSIDSWSQRQHQLIEIGKNFDVETVEKKSSIENESGLDRPNIRLTLLGAASIQASTVYSYVLDIPAGQVWPLHYYSEAAKGGMGSNFYDRILIGIASLDTIAKPVAIDDLPANLTIVDYPDTATFFPSVCEPCDPGAQIRMPALAPALQVPAASGGCLRPRFFNGMFISKEDLEAEQRYIRIKNRLHNQTIGQGVVWGIKITRHNEYLCIHPGYAIDCCGNDLTLTTAYKVEISSLLRDPIAAQACAESSQASKRMNLLLEYLECPTEPRPLHNDPCGEHQQVCEPSRIRETVRLRLVPPRDIDTSGPLRDFLMSAQRLHNKYSQQFKPVPDLELPASSKAFLLISAGEREFEVTENNSANFSASEIKIYARPNDGVFTGGILRISDREGTIIAESPLALFSLLNAAGQSIKLNEEHSQLIIELHKWRVESPYTTELNWADEGNTVFDLRLTDNGWITQWRNPQPHPAIQRTQVIRIPVCGEPCENLKTAGQDPDPCAPQAFSYSSIRWPWLHSDPLENSKPGDLKAVFLGIIGAWLQHSVVSSTNTVANQSWSFQRLAATTIYQAAWLLFYGVDALKDKQDVSTALEDLLRGWCDAALYTGPSCLGEPHGVVIGCVKLQAGELTEIDQHGGRRYVMQYPLLSHWGQQIGLAPLDASISRLFSMLCCIATLPKPMTSPTAPGFVIPVLKNRAFLAFGTEMDVKVAFKKETKIDFYVNETQEVGLHQFINYLILIFRGEVPPLNIQDHEHEHEGRVITRFTLGGIFESGVVSLVIVHND